MSSSSSSGLIVLIALLVVLLLYTVLNIVAVVKIITKAGYSAAWFLILFVPIIGTIMFYVFAFSKWPVIKRLEAIQHAGQFSAGPGGPTGIRARRAVRRAGADGTPRGRKVRRLRKGGHLRSPLVHTSLRGIRTFLRPSS